MENKSGITPFDMKVLVLPDKVAGKTAGGIHIPDTVIDRKKYAEVHATVVAVGDNAFKDMQLSVTPKAGDRVIIGKYTGDIIQGKDGKFYTLLNDLDIWATINFTKNDIINQ